MSIEASRRDRAGRLVAQPEGYSAFIPKPLPPDPPLAFDGGLLGLLEEAAGELGRLDGIAKVIPESAGELSEQTRVALEKAVRDSVETKLAELDQVASRAVETAREASDRLTAQMLSIGQSAAALEAHIERNREAQMKDGAT